MNTQEEINRQYRKLMLETSRKTGEVVLDYLERLKDKNEELHDICAELPRKKAGHFETRAFLLRICYEICSGEEWTEEIVKVGAAIELELYSMYYLNRVFDGKGGKDVLAKPHNQILAGMISRDCSSLLLAEACKNMEKEKLVKIKNILDEANKTVCAGQFLDLNKNIFEPDLNQDWKKLMDSYYKRSYLITASFYEKISLVGAILGNGSTEHTEALVNFAKHYGMMVQIINDISDFVPPEFNKGTEEKIPDDAFSDMKHGKLTLPILYTLINGTNRDKFEITKIFMEKDFGLEKLVSGTRLLVKNGSIASAKNIALKYADKAKSYLVVLPDEKKKLLDQLTFQAYANRYYKALQKFENNPAEDRSSVSGAIMKENYNSKDLVEMWDGLIDWKKRREGENGFLIKQLQKHNARKIFDAALGDGCDSIYLIKQGFDVTSNEIDLVFREKALQNAKANDVELRITCSDWRDLSKEVTPEFFDAVVILGNSLTYLFTREAQVKALEQFRRILKPGGVLIVDERNYQGILDKRKKILGGDFHYSGKYVYCGDRVHGRPIEISDDSVKFEYIDERNGKKAYLTMYPWKRGELRELLLQAGFGSIEQYSDYRPGENNEADFYQYVCVK